VNKHNLVLSFITILILTVTGCSLQTGQVVGTSAPQSQIPQPGSICRGSDLSPLGVLRSTDHGRTWTSLGNACIKDLHILPADPTPSFGNGRIMLFVVDLSNLNKPTPQSIYSTTSVDGLNFDAPRPVYTQPNTMVDPFILRLADGSFRMYVPSDPEGTISAVSRDGLTFSREAGLRLTGGGSGMPGALLLPDGQVRLFLSGDGIWSMISNDGLNFTKENGFRIPGPANSIVDNPEPIRLADGSYLMLYQVHDKKLENLLPWERDEIHLATSTDGYDWNPNPAILGYGGTSCVVEVSDGTLYIYYGTKPR